jgi:NADPH2:quinone reductase
MKAIKVTAFGGPEVLQCREVPDLVAGEGQLRIKICAIGVNPVETYMRSGNYPRLPVLPYTPGTDAAGIVEAVGNGVLAFKPGDRIYTSGTLTGAYAEYAICAESQAHSLPDPVSFEQGAALGIPYATAYRALFQRAKARAGESVLIHGGSGGVGIAAVQIACAAGLRVAATAGTETGRELVGDQGASAVFNHHDPDMPQQLHAWSSGGGVDIILEMLANVNLGKDLTLLAKGGRIVIIGSRGNAEINPRDAMSRDADILGMTLFNATPPELASIHAALVAGLKNRSLQPVIGRSLPLAYAPEAHRAVMEPGASGKVILLPH